MADLHSQTGFLQAQGAPLYYEVAGQGEPVLLIHAGVADSRMWDEQFAAFAQHYRTIRYDQRGYGRSQYPAGPFAYHEDPVELLKSLDIGKAHVVGISFGGKVALDFTLAHPEMVASLVLVAPSVGGTQPSELVQKFAEEEEAYLERGDLDAATELNLRMWVDGPQRTPEQVDPLVRERVRTMQYHAFTVPVPEGAETLDLQPPAITRLAEVQRPTLVIVGDYDIPKKLELSQQLAERLADAQQVIIPGVAHMVSMEQPEQFNRVVLSFLNKVAI
ncbi:alpha/beta fold hydrolase [Dictyobacter kobayashii]|uniref:Hydrolase n=1 Tax=Dictyobacter kobayashii TaxID=2014872 RepID=A0A402ARF9_9CHLR|nr:alpha/beta hydrolase [Dictyobacter kobayashii]GCE21691.1 hydrolase [Dictyobacter kobayashii]